jgi:hypothetical protein
VFLASAASPVFLEERAVPEELVHRVFLESPAFLASPVFLEERAVPEERVE